MAKVTPSKDPKTRTVVAKTKSKDDSQAIGEWWNAGSKKELAQTLVATATFLKERNLERVRKASVYARLYGNLPLSNWVGSSLSKMGSGQGLPLDRPTMNVVSSCTDTLVSRLSQARPRPIYLTDGGDYKQRTLSKQVNEFTAGEFYQAKAYKYGTLCLRDSTVLGTGVLKVLERDKRVAIERTLFTELDVDASDAFYGEPRTLYQRRLIDRGVLMHQFPEYRASIERAMNSYPDTASQSEKSVSDLVMVVESWHLPSGKDSGDGMHAIACSDGLLFEERWEKDRFPFVFLPYSDAMVGFWGQGLAERLMGTQVEINKLLMTITKAINIVGVPRVFVESGSKVVSAHLNNDIGAIIKYTGIKPDYEVAPCLPAELYGQLQRLVDYAYQQSGISSLTAAAQKPAGLDSGEAIRQYDDLQSDRFAELDKRYHNIYEDLAYLMLDKAMDIAKRDGKYQTVYPSKDGTKSIDLPAVEKLKNSFVFQCFDASSLPRDPAGRAQKVIEYMQAGLYSPEEGRRLLGFPDTEQVDKLKNAPEERILKILDEIVESGKYTPPDPFMLLPKAQELVSDYYNLYMSQGLEETKAEMLRTFSTQVKTLMLASMPPAPPAMPGAPGAPPPGPGGQLALPAPLPTSQMLPNVQASA